MSLTKAEPSPAPVQTWTAPQVIIPVIRIPQPDGSILFKAGKPTILENEIGTVEAARLLGLSQRSIELQCEDGSFKSAFKPGGKPGSKWRLARSEVLARRPPPDL